MKTWHYVAFSLLAISPVFSMRLAPNQYEGGRSRDESDREVRNGSAIATILGEVRTNMSDLMFIKTERYLHAGVAYMPHIDMDKIATTGEIADKPRSGGAGSMAFAADLAAHEAEVGQAQDDHAGHEPEHAATLIPPPESDFRGLIGYLHRAVKPWQDPSHPHHHTTGKELLPWYRLITLTDPNNVRGYLIGAWWLKTNQGGENLDEALKFIDEGIANNPRAFALHLMKGNILRQMGRNAESIPVFHEAAEQALAARPHDRVQPFLDAGTAITLPDWTDYNEDDSRAAVRMAVLSEREFGSVDKALELAIRYDTGFGGDGRLKEMISELQGGAPAPE